MQRRLLIIIYLILLFNVFLFQIKAHADTGQFYIDLETGQVTSPISKPIIKPEVSNVPTAPTPKELPKRTLIDMYTLDDVHVRAGKGTDTKIFETYAAFSPVRAYADTEHDDWVEIDYHGQSGYIMNRYIGSFDQMEYFKEKRKKEGELPYSQKLADLGIDQETQKYCWKLAGLRYPEDTKEKRLYYASIIGVSSAESHLKANTKSSSGDYGVMQVNRMYEQELIKLGLVSSMTDLLYDLNLGYKCGELYWWPCYELYGFSEKAYARYLGYWKHPDTSNKRTQRAWRIMQEWRDIILS